MSGGPALRLDLSIPPEWERIDPTREAVGMLVQAVYGDDDLRDALAMVSEELLENAIKYSKPETDVSLSIHNEPAGVVIEVTNAVDDASTHVGTLRERVEWMARFASPSEAYTAAISNVRERKAAGHDPGLGIVRIAYEGGCRIDIAEPARGRLTVRAACLRTRR